MAKIIAIYKYDGLEQRFVVPTHILNKIGTYFEINPRLISKRYPYKKAGPFTKNRTLADCRKVYWLWLFKNFGFSPTNIARIEGLNHSTVVNGFDKFHLIEDDYKQIFNETEKEDNL